MAQRINTGNYQVCRNRTGISNAIQVLITGNRETIDQYWNELVRDAQYNYYRNEEVFYRDTQKDESGNDVDTAPGWVRM